MYGCDMMLARFQKFWMYEHFLHCKGCAISFPGPKQSSPLICGFLPSTVKRSGQPDLEVASPLCKMVGVDEGVTAVVSRLKFVQLEWYERCISKQVINICGNRAAKSNPILVSLLNTYIPWPDFLLYFNWLLQIWMSISQVEHSILSEHSVKNCSIYQCHAPFFGNRILRIWSETDINLCSLVMVPVDSQHLLEWRQIKAISFPVIQ